LSFTPLHNPIGFGAVDFIELAVAAILVALALFWRPVIAPLAARFARKTVWCMIFLAALPVVLRLILLSSHPVPKPDLYDEFGHLLMADTLRHWRLANPAHPMHRFFETFFVLQQPTYSSIYPIGNALALVLGWTVFGSPWAGVLLCTAAFCSLCYWMLRGWTTPGWALLGGMLAVFEFGPLNQWTNNYWGGGFSAAAGCLVFGALPRRNWTLLGLGLALHLLSRPYESVFLFMAVALYLAVYRVRPAFRPVLKTLVPGAAILLAAFGITLAQNKSVTGYWTELPYQLSQYQYGVPAVLTFQQTPTPHASLTPEQELDYRMQSNFHPGRDTLSSYLARLLFRIRYYRFYFYAPLYLALVAFLMTIRSRRWLWVPLTCILFALGINFFPAFQFHYLAAVACLFILMSVRGLREIGRLPHGTEVARVVIFLCVAQFVFWYSLHLPDSRAFAASARRFDVWDNINHGNPERRIAVDRELAGMPGRLLIFVRYWPQHIFQDEWVYNGADIDGQRIVWARDLGDDEDRKLAAYYRDRRPLLLEPDARLPRLRPWEPAPAPAAQPEVKEEKKDEKPPAHPAIEFESVPPAREKP
jgi:hypothetical protein